MVAHTAPIPKKLGHCKKKKKKSEFANKTELWLLTSFTKCPLSPCSYGCLRHFEEAPFILILDTITCYQWNCLNVEGSKQVFLEDYTTFPPCVSLVTTCLKRVAGIKLGLGSVNIPNMNYTSLTFLKKVLDNKWLNESVYGPPLAFYLWQSQFISGLSCWPRCFIIINLCLCHRVYFLIGFLLREPQRSNFRVSLQKYLIPAAVNKHIFSWWG